MLLHESAKPFNEAGWIFEEKLDGWRALAVDGQLWSRHGNPLPHQFPSLTSLPADTILDGELVSIQDGRSCLRSLQRQRGPFQYGVFDVLRLGGDDVTGLPLVERRKLLDGLALGEGVFTLAQHEDGVELFQRMKADGREGIVGKRLASRYEVGKRVFSWMKVKVCNQ